MLLLVNIAIRDARTQKIHDLHCGALLLFSVLYHVSVYQSFTLLPSLIIGGFFLVQWLLSKGQWIGSGDVELGFVIGILFGDPQQAILCILLSYILGAICVMVLILTGKKHRKDTIAFGPFLVVSAILTLFCGSSLLAIA